MTDKNKSDNKTISIYITDRAVYDNLADDVGKLWYGKTGHKMTKGETIIKSLLIAKHYLSDTTEHLSSKDVINVKKIGRL